ncbi:hypothetical protein G7Y89_g15827 [Cudoniella acicularis]|uniref:Uncharacterized protein n=1 Tax=Cudoniella acicularis TaxID=354080 RepID=A0A8H4QFL9_9HELO|nr:hypothetical protein G7Y89_g15827 [Cudoniella acicularis]
MEIIEGPKLWWIVASKHYPGKFGSHPKLPYHVAIHRVIGTCIGTTLTASFILTRIELRREDIASTVGTSTQLRVFGGVIGVVICRVTQSSYLRHHLSLLVAPATLNELMLSVAAISQLPPKEAIAVG